MQDDADQQRERQPTTLSYATSGLHRPRLGIAGLLCAFVTPLVYVLLVVLGIINMHPGWRVAVNLGMVAFLSAIIGLSLSVLSLRREGTSRYAIAGLLLSIPALCFNCFALSNAT